MKQSFQQRRKIRDRRRKKLQAPHERERPSRFSFRKKALFAILPVAFILVSLEVTLRCIGFESPTADPYESFVLHHPLFLPDGERLRTGSARTQFFHDQVFERIRPANTKRVFVFGGSTTYGWALPEPQRDNSYVNQLGNLLEKQAPGTRFEMINCGGLSYASYRLVDLVEECVDYSPDLIIVMSGHNEFIEARHYAGLIGADSAQSRLWYSLRTVRLLYHFSNKLLSNKRPQPVLGDNPFITEHYIVRDQEEFDQTFDHYSRNLNRMVDACKDHRVPVILCTCPSNLLDHPPFYTEPPESMNEAEFYSQVGKAIKLIESGQHEEALTMAQGVLRDDPRSAIFHYIAGKCYFEMQRFKEAKASLILAKETDAFPKRALDSFNGFVRDLARESNLELFDAEAVFFAESEHGIPGENLFIDDCHPTVKGHRLFAEGLKEIAATILREESKRNSE